MIPGLIQTKKTPEETDAFALYDMAVRQGRQEVFYRDMNVPDTVDGRFEMIALHVILILARLSSFRQEEADALSQALFDQMFRDMDRSLREMGVSDLAVPKRMKVMMNGFNGRAQAYRQALEEGAEEATLRTVVRRNIYGTLETVSPDCVERMASYIREQSQAMKPLTLADMQGRRNVFLSEGEKQS